MVEESVKKSTGWAVFEPNDANLWTKIKSMIDNYLIQKWREGALAGATPDQAFYVKIGLGQTMTAQDVPGAADRRDRHGGRAAGRVHHPQVLAQDAGSLSPQSETSKRGTHRWLTHYLYSISR